MSRRASRNGCRTPRSEVRDRGQHGGALLAKARFVDAVQQRARVRVVRQLRGGGHQAGAVRAGAVSAKPEQSAVVAKNALYALIYELPPATLALSSHLQIDRSAR